ncbi:MAG: hypothetical protein ABIK19_02015 [candidate division WOR-3 bacterium]
MKNKLTGPIYLMQPIPYFGEKLNSDWIIEPKIDGWRLQIIKYQDGKIEYWGRRLDKKPNWTEKLKFLDKGVAGLPNGTLLDCELFSSKGRRYIPSLFANTKKAKPIIYVFDVVFYNDVFVGNLSLKQRKTILNQLSIKPPLQLIKWTNYKEPLQVKAMSDCEGVIFKNLNSKYLIGIEAPLATADWRKIKWR